MSLTGVRAAGSLGIAAYCDRLAASLREIGVDYTPAVSPRRGTASHLHLGNSSRAVVAHALRLGAFVVTVHDVVPRDPRLMPLYRALVYPAVVRRAAAVVVHSRVAADMLIDVAGVAGDRVRVIPLPATAPQERDRAGARASLGWGAEEVVAVLPGVLKSAKLVRHALSAARDLDGVRLVLSGRVADGSLTSEAADAGAQVIASPDDRTYQRAILGADVVLVLRNGSVGESNLPLLDALGAGRPVIATRSGSIPEVAGKAAIYVEAEPTSIRRALARAADEGERATLARHAAARAAELSPHAAARAHAELFEEVFGVR